MLAWVMQLAVAGGTRPPDGPATLLARPDLGLFVVASPMGATHAAATFTFEALVSHFELAKPDASAIERAPRDVLGAAVRAAALGWQERVAQDRTLRGVGASIAAVLLRGDVAAVAHLGDCRVTQVRNGQVLRETSDHVSHAAKGHSLVIKAIGMDTEPDWAAWSVQRGDTLVLTAVVHDFVSDDELLHACSGTGDVKQAASALIALAASREALDDLTVLVVRT
ncbi:MAG TPA: hypothetical protein VJV78_17195 [Polyangiales bacterium]|nr:hypothetical protein [Polyangiales bacterium]